MYELPWVLIFVTIDAIRQWVSLMKILAELPRSWQRISIHDSTYIILFATCHILCPEHKKSAKNNHQSLILPMSEKTVFSDLALWRHHSWFVTLREREEIALWRHIRRAFLQAEIGAIVIFTSE